MTKKFGLGNWSLFVLAGLIIALGVPISALDTFSSIGAQSEKALEPASLVLLGAGLVGVAAAGRRRALRKNRK